jgi:hypothetical protein
MNDIIGRLFLTCLGGTKLFVLAESVKSNSFSDGGVSGLDSFFLVAGIFLLTLFSTIFFNLDLLKLTE